MRKCLLFGLAVLLVCMSFAGFAGASSIASYQIFSNRVLVELNLGDVGSLELRIPSDALAVELNTQNYKINYSGSYKIVDIGNAQNLTVKYITESLVEKSGGRYFFILKNELNEGSDIAVYLPEGAVLSADERKLIVPNPDEILSDGRRIILNWNNFDKEEIVVAYEFVGQSYLVYWIVLGILIVAGFAAFYLVKIKKLKQKVQKKVKGKARISEKKVELTRNLFGEEKQIVEYLLERKKHECWTKEIVKDLNISKVRASRRLRDLEKKGLVERVSYGNENRIRLIKK